GNFKASLAAGGFDGGFEGVEGFAGGDEESVAILAAEADVGGPAFGDVDLTDFGTGLVKNVDAFARDVEVLAIVQGHAVGAHFAVEFFVGGLAGGGEVVAVGFFVA